MLGLLCEVPRTRTRRAGSREGSAGPSANLPGTAKAFGSRGYTITPGGVRPLDVNLLCAPHCPALPRPGGPPRESPRAPAAAPCPARELRGSGGHPIPRAEASGLLPSGPPSSSRWAFKRKGRRDKTMGHAQAPEEDAGICCSFKPDETQILAAVLQILTLGIMSRFSPGESLGRQRAVLLAVSF